MPIRIALIDRIVVGVGVAVGADAGLDGVERVGGEEAADHRVVIAGVEIEQPVSGSCRSPMKPRGSAGAAGEQPGTDGAWPAAQRTCAITRSCAISV